MCQDIGVATEKTAPTITPEELVSVPRAAKEIGVDFSTVYRWIKKGVVTPIRIAAQVFLTVDDVKALKQQRQAAVLENRARSSVEEHSADNRKGAGSSPAEPTSSQETS